MEHLRFPIGRFEHVPLPSLVQQKQWIAVITEIVPKLRQMVHNLKIDQLNTPYRPGGWSIQQVIHHIADNDMNAFIRFKRALTEESPLASTYQEDKWAELRDYQIPIDVSLNLQEAVHIRFVAVLRGLQTADFARTFTSPTHGVMSLDMALQRFVWHNRHHVAQISSLKERMGW
jgi:uncharacterized damage-inducible protein DinB